MHLEHRPKIPKVLCFCSDDYTAGKGMLLLMCNHMNGVGIVATRRRSPMTHCFHGTLDFLGRYFNG